MPDIIQLLPDSVANQIAAGEVIQRPASVVKELMENSVDAGADEISIIIKDAGKTLVQVIDNGVGMSDTDARLSFERHATSKIRDAQDLFEIRTKGFRGEALASIASIAQVEMKTCQVSNEVGTFIRINGSELELQEVVSCPTGCNISVKNLFFNVPARRKFLKSNTTEFKHILNEFQRVTLTHPEIDFKLLHNDQTIFHLVKTNLKQRIIHLFGKQINQSLNNLETFTSLVKIKGFIGKPEMARKTTGEQYFFVNNRYMRHAYFHRAVMKAYENLIAPDCYPSYFIYMEIDPKSIDINIHPTKTEIKFENEQALFQILHASVKESIGKSNVAPSIDFDSYGIVDIPVVRKSAEIKSPEIPVNHEFNPFKDTREARPANFGNRSGKSISDNWEELFEITKKGETFTEGQYQIFESSAGKDSRTSSGYIQVNGKYIITGVKSGLMVIDQRRAHQRILYEEFVRRLALNQITSQKSLYPEKIDLSTSDYIVLGEIMDDLAELGFEISDLGSNTIVVNGLPAILEEANPKSLIETLLEEYKQTESAIVKNLKERLAMIISKASAIPSGKELDENEMLILVDQLFACETPNYSPSGKKCVAIIGYDELNKALG